MRQSMITLALCLSLAIAACAAPVKYHDASVFRAAYQFIEQGQYEKALPLLVQNITRYPGAVDGDYDYGWACFCAAKLGSYDEALQYYKVMQTRFRGTIYGTGPQRNWEDHLSRIRQDLAASSDARARTALQQMLAFDEAQKQQRLAEAFELIDMINRRKLGKEKALATLQGIEAETFAELVADGLLTPRQEGSISRKAAR